MKIVSVAVAKGGTGKTTTAINLAALLAADGRRVALLDLDPQASATLVLGASASGSPLTESAVPIEGEAFVLYPGGRSLALASAEQVAERIRQVAAAVDILVLDTPPALSAPTLEALRAASLVLVPMEASQLSLPALADVAATLEALGRGDRLRILLSRVKTVRRLTREVAEVVAADYPGALYPVAVPEDVRAAEMIPVRGPQSQAATAFAELAGLVVGDLQ